MNTFLGDGLVVTILLLIPFYEKTVIIQDLRREKVTAILGNKICLIVVRISETIIFHNLRHETITVFEV